MVSARKRSIQEVDSDAAQPPKEPTLLHRLRNMWQFANVCQFLAIFGTALKMEAVDIDDLEAECLKPYSMALNDIGLGFLKFLSSHRGLTHELFDEYTRRQFTSKAPEVDNPFGNDEVALKFSDFDIFKKIRVLHQMTLLILRHPEKIRERIAELKDADHDQTAWRIEPLGWDEDDHTYFLLDDNRLYRLTEAPPPPPPAPKPKKNSKKARALARAEKRRRISAATDGVVESADDSMHLEDERQEEKENEAEDDGLGGAKWECVAVTLSEVRQFLAPLQKTRDPNEKVLRGQIEEHLVPLLERQEERRKKKEKEREKELFNLERMANAKRSSRLAHKAEQHRHEEQSKAEEQKRLAEEVAARKEEERQRKLEKERNSRLMSREKRLREREARRLQHEEELAQLSEDSRGVGAGEGGGRMSERRLQLEIEKNKQALRDLEDEGEEWVFDCVCGLHGQVDDGEHSVACERCNVWQHSKCLGIDQDEAEREDFHFICVPCRKHQDDKERLRPRTTIKLKIGSGSSAPAARKSTPATSDSGSRSSRAPSLAGSGLVIQLPAQPVASASATVQETPRAPQAAASSPVLLPPPEQSSFTIPIKASAAGEAAAPTKASTIKVHNPFSSPHPDLSPPHQSPNKSRAYDTIFDQSSPPAASPAGRASGNLNGTAPKVNGRVRISTTPILPPVPPHYRSGSSLSRTEPSPSKQSPGAPDKARLPQALARSSQSSASSAAGGRDGSPTSSLLVTPQIKPVPADAHYTQNSSPLPPAKGGVSPTKHSPSLPPAGANGMLPSSSPTPPVLPPIAALSPSPRPQDLTPPVKPATAAAPPPVSLDNDVE